MTNTDICLRESLFVELQAEWTQTAGCMTGDRQHKRANDGSAVLNIVRQLMTTFVPGTQQCVF